MTLTLIQQMREAAAEIERLRKRCSPSRVVMIGDVGHYVSEGVAEGIESLRQAVKPFAEFDLLEHRIPPEFAMLVLRARGALERVVVTPWHWNLLHGVDRADMLAFGRACMEAERERCAALCEAHAGMRGTGAWTVLTAAADRIRDPERAKRDAAPDSGA